LFALGVASDVRPRNFWVVDPDPTEAVFKRFYSFLGPTMKNRAKRIDKTFASFLMNEATSLIPA
jgi:hypothetical protein